MSIVRQRRLLGLAVILSLFLFVRGCVLRPANSNTGGQFNQGRNAVWLGVEWVNEPRTDAAIKQLARDMAQRQFQYGFVYTTYLRNNGSFNPTFAHAVNFLQVFKSEQPSIKLLAWIGLPLRNSLGNVDLSDSITRRKIVDLCVELVHNTGFDGIHLDPEIVHDNDKNVLRLLEEVRQTIKPALLSIATRHIQPLFPNVTIPLGDLLGWHSAYYRDVATRVDQIAVMSYDSTLPLGVLYRLWMRFQVINISKAIQGTGVELLFGVPTSEESTATHNPSAENMANGLQGIIDGLNDHESIPAAVSGVAIYPYWETDTAEWSIYESRWLK
ncbi:MAG: hypothetical protein IT324_26625, partial [Anaerolineae bacterium]|nr:hypothetical protein [Anaerolineae bacterium]